MKKVLFLLILSLSLSIFCFVNLVHADDPTGGKKCPDGQVCLDNPLTGAPTSIPPQEFIGRIIKAILGIVGSLALVMFVYGGFNWMTAAGNAEKVEKGKQILVWATIGLIVIFTSYALVKFVFTSLGV